ncbi:MAG: hypothetical protein WCE54_09010 [Ignavibacteriaceae bacterium]
MEKKTHKFKLHLLELLSVIFLFSFCIQAQSYNSDTTKTDTTKSDSSNTKKDTLGYNINSGGSNVYSLNNFNSEAYLQDSSITDTSKTDTTYKKSDTLGYSGNGRYILAIKMNYRSYLQDSSMTDTSKTDTLWKKSDSLGFNNIKSPDYSYAYEGRPISNYYFQDDSSMTDTSKTDTTKSDTLGYNNKKGSYYAYDNSGFNSPSGLDKRTNYLINPVKDLTQKLKLNVYLMDAQTGKVQEILREYEAKTYQSNGNNEELNKAAVNALNNIANILTVRQKKEWENAKNEWWASVNKALNLSYISKNKYNLQ